jgi:hypothetical protein
MSAFPKMVAADVPDLGRMYYLVDAHLDFIVEVKEFLEKMPLTVQGTRPMEWLWEWRRSRKCFNITQKNQASPFILMYYAILTQQS